MRGEAGDAGERFRECWRGVKEMLLRHSGDVRGEAGDAGEKFRGCPKGGRGCW